MPESFINQTEGSGKKARTFQRVIGANTVEEQYVIIGQPAIAAYTCSGAAALLTTAASHIMQLMAGASLHVYIHRIQAYQLVLETAATIVQWDLFRLSSAGTGGTALTPAQLDTADAASGAAGMTLPTAKGTETTKLYSGTSQCIQTVPTGGVGLAPLILDWDFDKLLRGKLPRIAAGTSNGIALKQVTGAAAASAVVVITFSEANV